MSSSGTAVLPTPLSEASSEAVARLVEGLDGERLWWLSGYFAGLARAGGAPIHVPRPPVPPPESSAQATLTIAYGSQTGNARRTAESLAHQAGDAGLAVRLVRLDGYPLRELRGERYLCVVISTQGDGDPPDDAREFMEFITGRRVPRLDQLRYAVLGLGDSTYPRFCAVARTLDRRLAELGAQRLLDHAEADIDIETIATPWLRNVVDVAGRALRTSPAHVATVVPLRVTPTSAGTHDQPHTAELIANQRLTPGSDKDIRHVELSLDGSGLLYEPGDALGIWPRNPVPLVDSLLETLQLDGDEAVTSAGQTLALRTWLRDRRELTRLARPFVTAHAGRAIHPDLHAVLEGDPVASSAWFRDRQVLDVLQQYPAEWSGQALVEALRPLTPRLYSIASSRKYVGDEVHLTVAHVEYVLARGERRWGAASHWIASSAEGDTYSIYIERNERFRLPADAARDVIMIGPGTGVAPFRAFVQEREAIGASGRHWLLFGNPHFRTDFLYQLEWQRALRTGRLDRLDVAFSRDQVEKVYVQQRLREQGRRLFDWLEGGAHLYVCGAIAMGRDAHTALVDMIVEHGGRSREAATEYLDGLQRQGRYARDVY